MQKKDKADQYSKPFPKLATSFKKSFPFRISAPSFVYPDDWVANVTLLGPYLDEIELLLFEGNNSSLPSENEIITLKELMHRLEITFNIHLPLDLNLGATDADSSQYAINQLAKIVKLVHPLSPTTYTLHLPCDLPMDSSASQVHRWQMRTQQNLSNLLDMIPVTSKDISVETLNYPPQWFAPIVADMDFSICVDVGHLLRYGFDLKQTLSDFSHSITIIHLHGVNQGRDHLSLDMLPRHAIPTMQAWLKSFTGTVSLELFSFSALQPSLKYLLDMMRDAPDN